ncbi:MAG: imidazoleglycerol-phosphate dehydratase HisB [Candidatus Latescibacterota bacterium]|nr:imidazoleglycerol-phosphate dehydratase HisB [Candidatus Latescibacterota bacterium]
MNPRFAKVARKTSETDITLELYLDGNGRCDSSTGVGFFDHMLDAFSRHGLFDLKLKCNGDHHVDAHHTVEDVGICLGMAIEQALSEKQGIVRFGQSHVPMDEALARCVVDLSGRSYLVFNAAFADSMVGAFPTALVAEFFQAVTAQARMNVHIDLLRSGNDHHGIEAVFKAFGRALDAASFQSDRVEGIPSTKGSL